MRPVAYAPLIGATLLLVGCTAEAQASRRQFVPIATQRFDLGPCTVPVQALPMPTTDRAPAGRADLRVVGEAAWLSGGCHHLAVELVNEGTAVAYYPEVEATYRDASGSVVGRVRTRLPRYRVMRGERATARLSIQPPAGWRSYELRTEWPPIDEDTFASGLEVTDVRSRREDDTFFVTGRLRNPGFTLERDATVEIALFRNTQLLDAGAVKPFGRSVVGLREEAAFELRFFDPEERLIGAEVLTRVAGIPTYAP